MKGKFEYIVFHLMDDDTFSRDDHMGTAKLSFKSFSSAEFTEIKKCAFEGTLTMTHTKGENIGTFDVEVEYSPGDIDMFDGLTEVVHRD